MRRATPTDEWPMKWPLIFGRGIVRDAVNIRMT